MSPTFCEKYNNNGEFNGRFKHTKLSFNLTLILNLPRVKMCETQKNDNQNKYLKQQNNLPNNVSKSMSKQERDIRQEHKETCLSSSIKPIYSKGEKISRINILSRIVTWDYKRVTRK